MYGNVETALDKAWGAGEGCPPPPAPDEDPYEPLDPSPTPPKPLPSPPRGSPRPSPPGRRWGRGRVAAVAPVAPVALVALVALAVALLLILGTLGARRISELEAALEAERAKERPPPAAPQPSSSFLLYNEHHSSCVLASGRTLGLSHCSPSMPAQRFLWLPRGRLLNLATGLCVTATASTERALVRLAPCQEDSRLQGWACGPGALLELAGTALHFNFGHSAEGEVLLFGGKGEWSRWLVYSTRDAVCSRACFPPCSKGWVFFRNSCYFFSKSAASWDVSQFFCSALGSQLLEVDDAEEKSHVQAQLRGPSWLGIRDREQEGTWSRGDGTALGPNSTWWHRDEPNGGTLENCAAVRQDGLWADYPCGTPLAWVCEGPP